MPHISSLETLHKSPVVKSNLYTPKDPIQIQKKRFLKQNKIVNPSALSNIVQTTQNNDDLGEIYMDNIKTKKKSAINLNPKLLEFTSQS